MFLQRKEQGVKDYLPILKRTKLFAGIEDAEITLMLSCLEARSHSYRKGQYVLRQGEHLSDILILVNGCLHIIGVVPVDVPEAEECGIVPQQQISVL